jgi:hypothetical protein
MKTPKAAAMPAISGSYRGPLTSAPGERQRLDLRIDVDSRIPEAAVLKRVSGDIFRIDKTAVPGKPPIETEVYQESWILEQPQVKKSTASVIITGTIRFWNGTHPKATARIRIPRSPKNAAAEVTLQLEAATPMTFSCKPAGKFFRSVRLEAAVCKSVDAKPTLPIYGTHSLAQRPADLTDRVLTLDGAYGEAGVELVIERGSVVDDTGVTSWTDAELHNAMEHHFSRYNEPWPRWDMWGLLAGQYEDDNVGGVMFDYAGAEGGAGEAPERQGFAVFRNHFWFKSLVPKPSTPAELEAARRFLWTFTHEAGHAFNLLHSFDKNRENARSWMNYVENYDERNGGPGAYWRDFRFSFDEEELLHIRHGNRSSVIMGGDPWSSGGHAEAPPGAEHLRVPPGALNSISGGVPLEVLVRAQPYFEFLEPVSIEIRTRNLLPIPASVSTALHPEFGTVTIYIRRPDGRIVEYMPICCKVAPERTITLSPAGAADSSDRHSRSVFVSYGRYGFYFDEPGQYYIRALYHGLGNVLIPSNVMRVRVGHPRSQRADRIAQDFFSYESGTALYLGGSHSGFLSRGMDTLMAVAEEQGDTLAGAKTAARIARGVAMPFHDLSESEPAAVTTTGGDPDRAMHLSGIAIEAFRKEHSPNLCIAMERIVRTRAEVLMRTGNPEQARDELLHLAGDLDAAGVKPSVTAKIAEDAETCGRS